MRLATESDGPMFSKVVITLGNLDRLPGEQRTEITRLARAYFVAPVVDFENVVQVEQRISDLKSAVSSIEAFERVLLAHKAGQVSIEATLMMERTGGPAAPH